ncbi:MAG: hypothetical protein P8N25_00250 [Alphaproteobacteria bacterium]|nr:hypothetical protein [Alphaproteobacteria bacterium]
MTKKIYSVEDAILNDLVEEINLLNNIKNLVERLDNDEIRSKVIYLININLKAVTTVKNDWEA